MQSQYKALSDPTRREILSLLTVRSMSAGELAACFSIGKASLSHHFNILKQADLVRTERRGQSIIYTLNASAAEEIAAAVLNLFGVNEKTSDEHIAKGSKP